jgi:short-subunit dehydrogenase
MLCFVLAELEKSNVLLERVRVKMFAPGVTASKVSQQRVGREQSKSKQQNPFTFTLFLHRLGRSQQREH